jgi:hypothetical protein
MGATLANKHFLPGLCWLILSSRGPRMYFFTTLYCNQLLLLLLSNSFRSCQYFLDNSKLYFQQSFRIASSKPDIKTFDSLKCLQAIFPSIKHTETTSRSPWEFCRFSVHLAVLHNHCLNISEWVKVGTSHQVSEKYWSGSWHCWLWRVLVSAIWLSVASFSKPCYVHCSAVSLFFALCLCQDDLFRFVHGNFIRFTYDRD